MAVRATPGLPDAVIEFIAQVSEPRSAVIRANEWPEEFVREICGVNTTAFDRVFYNEVNKDKIARERWAKPRPVKVPACVKWRRDVQVRVRAGDTLDDILVRRVGRTESQPLVCPSGEASRRCNKTLRELVQEKNPGKDLDRLQEGQQIVLPFATYLTTFKVKASANLSAEQVTQKIAELGRADIAGSPIIKNFVAPAVRLLAPIAGDELGEACGAASTIAKTAWPYDANLISMVITRNLARAKETDNPLSPVTVSVIDTGLDTTFPEGLLRRDATVDPKYAYGIGSFRQDNMRPFPDHEPIELRLHGTQVAEILTGGSGLRAAFPELAKLFRINVVNVIEPGTAKGDYHITTEGVNIGADWAAANAQIANVSIGSAKPLVGLRDAVARQPQLLLVAAAGNESDDLGQFALYPANFGGTNDVIGTQVITVAAHDANLARAPFSNLSKDYVDLMAPGCDIPYKSGTPGLHGTSFAAPIISMTAALLRAFGVKTPKDVKRRLQASLDFDEDLDGLVLWSGRLNIPKALSLYDDVLQRQSGELTFGRWQPGEQDVCSDKPIDLDKIKKVTAMKDKNPFRVRVLYLDPENALKPHVCKPAGDGLSFVDQNGTSKEIPWSEFADLVPRFYRGLN